MKRLAIVAGSCLLQLLVSQQAGAIDDLQYASIKQLGKLNGVALQCGYIDQTRRMKQAMIDNLPKRRELGLAFDEISNESFMQFIQQADVCPPAGSFSRQVDLAIGELEETFRGSAHE